MDRTAACGAAGLGSIPGEGTFKQRHHYVVVLSDKTKTRNMLQLTHEYP